jgi:hypothetical protein
LLDLLTENRPGKRPILSGGEVHHINATLIQFTLDWHYRKGAKCLFTGDLSIYDLKRIFEILIGGRMWFFCIFNSCQDFMLREEEQRCVFDILRKGMLSICVPTNR